MINNRNITVRENDKIGEKFYYLKHESGLDIFVVPKSHTTCSAVFATNYGSCDRTFKTNQDDDFITVPDGVAHFLEHKLFENEDGTDSFERFGEFGGNANAYTSFARTSYLFTCAENFKENLSILLDFVTHPFFREDKVKKEQGIIGEEIKMYIDDPSWRVYFNLNRALYVNHPVRVDIAGTVETIADITPEILYRCYNTFYNLNNMILVVSGDVTMEEVLSVADKILPAENKKIEIESQMPAEPSHICQKLIIEKGVVALPLYNIGLKMPHDALGRENIKRSVAVDILLLMFFGKSSDFYLKNYESGLLNARFGFGYDSFSGASHISFSGMGVDYQTVFDIIKNEFDTRLRGNIDENEFLRIKKTFYASSIGNFESTEDITNMFSASMLSDRINAFEYIDIIGEIDFEYLKSVTKLIDTENMAMSVVAATD